MSDYPQLLSRAAQLIRQSELAPFASQIEALLLTGIALQTQAAPDDEIALGNSKIGGWPDVPRDFAWPFFRDEPLSFIAQFHLEELARFDINGVLPSGGRLAFFSALRPVGEVDDSHMHGDIGLMQATRGAWRVVHFDGAQTLERAAPPDRDLGRIYESQAVSKVWNVVSVPDSSALELKTIFDDEAGDGVDEMEAYFDLQDEIEALNPPERAHHALLGNAHFYQDDARYTAERFTRGWEYQAQIPLPELRAIAAAATRWRLLLQLGDHNDMSWAGDGRGYFLLPFEELKARRFEASYFGVQR